MNQEKMQKWLIAHEVDAFLLLSDANRRYFTGFTGSNGVVMITKDQVILITDQRYTEQAIHETTGIEVVTHGIDPVETFRQVADTLKIETIAYESKRITDDQLTSWKALQKKWKWIPTKDVGLQLRAVKTETEINLLKQSLAIAEKAFMEVIELIRPGITEREIKVELEYRMQKYGSEGVAFDTIVASGKRSSLPHGTPTEKQIQWGEPIVIDFGAVYGGYHSDLTRTVWMGEPDPKLYWIFERVLAAQEKAIEAIAPGKTCMEIDGAHREIFSLSGIEPYSLRGLGHGVGLEIHEEPRVVIKNEAILEKNMVFTVEPGIYIPDMGGIRTEDMVVVTETGAKVLSNLPNKIIIDHKGV